MKRPIVFIFIFYVLGILCSIESDLTNLTLFFCIVLIVNILICKRYNYKIYIIFSLFFILGVGITKSSAEVDDSLYQENTTYGYVYDVVAYDSFNKVYIKTNKINEIEEKIKLYAMTNTELAIGDKISFVSEYLPLDTEEYNEKLYEGVKGVKYKTFINEYNYLGEEENISTHLNAIANKLKTNYYLLFDKYDASIVTAMILGIRDIDENTDMLYKTGGLYHFLAISGLHIGIIIVLMMTILNAIFGSTYFKKRRNGLIVIIFLIFYTIMTGMSISTIRALLMASIILLSPYFYRKNDSLNSLFLAAMIILLIEPRYIFTVGFLLSFFATFGIIFYTPVMKAFINKIRIKFNIKKNFDIGLSLLISIYLFTMPISIYYFDYLYPYSIFVNIILIPFIPIVVMLSFLIGIISLISMTLANILAYVVSFLLTIMEYVSTFVYNLPYSSILIEGLPLNIICMYYVLIIYIGIIYYKWNR